MQAQDDREPWNVRLLLESTATPFSVAKYRPRAPVYLQGDPCDRVMYIEQGRVWLAATARRGKEVICDLPGPGAFFGEDALFGRSERRLSATAATSTQVLVVGKAHMIRLLRTQPDLVAWFLAHLVARHTRLEANLTEQLLYSSELRLAHTLLSLADCTEEGSHRCPLPHLSQQIIAEMVGTTRSRVNFFMRRFKKRGFIEEKRGVLLVNPAHLVHSERPAHL